jgi:hypothetical protein
MEDACQRGRRNASRLRERGKRRGAVERHEMCEVEARDEFEKDDLVVLGRGLEVGV